ncbi:MAG: YdcF family protein [Nitrospinae bacterium]|nr:YdcF family protein [Nitrospinota bacterium]
MKRKIIASLILIIVLLLSQYDFLLKSYARFFTIDNATIGMEAAIVILAGSSSTRIPKALDLYKAGYGTRLLLTTVRSMNSKVAQIYMTREQEAQEIAKILNSPAQFEFVPSLKGGATSTFDEAYDLLAFCTKENVRHIIIVTDSFHTRRALFAFKKVFRDSNIKVEVSATANEIFNEENWWLSDVGISAYILEPIKLAVYLVTSQNISAIKND